MKARFLPAALCVLVMAAAIPARAQDWQPEKQQLQAAFLYRFIDFIEWPAEMPRENGAILTIGIIGKNPFGAALNALSGKTTRGKTIAIKQITTLADLRNVYVLFISPSEKDRLAQILSRTRGLSILTVSEINGFPQRGGIINLTTENNKVRFEINPSAAQRARLRISSQLLKLAKIVRA
jgi:hypothetical protein